jgi:deazaflavin-dependent oxidoreductase (nitroreductase family)
MRASSARTGIGPVCCQSPPGRFDSTSVPPRAAGGLRICLERVGHRFTLGDANADLDFCYLTTTGRKSGLGRTVEIWFSLVGDTLYLLSGGRDEADWVRNLLRSPQVKVRLGDLTRTGLARIVEAPDEDARARRLLDAKYMGWAEGKRLSGWARTALPVAVDLET